MQNNKKGFSIIMAMGLVIFINLIALGILEYAVPFSRETKNIENVAVSYYQADSGIENALFYLKSENFEPGTESGTSLTNDAISSSFDIIGVGEKLPPIGQGDSEYNQDWNQIAIGNPIQLEIGYGKVDFDNAIFAFRVPDLNNGNFTLTLSGGFDDLPVVNWQISSQNNTLNATGSYITPNSICNSGEVFFDCDLDLSGLQGIDLNGEETSDQEIGNFYDNNCDSVGSGCILKLSIINKLEDDNNNISIPYLEWKIDFNSLVPLRYSIIETDGKAYGYKKSLKVRIPQQTTNEAFDFTVFQ